MSWKDPIKPKVPSFDEVMGDSKSSSVPSFDDVMGGEKKNSSLSVGVDGQLKQSAPITSVSQDDNTPNPFDISTLAPKKLDNSQQPLQFDKPKENPYTPENNFGLFNLPVEKPISDNTANVSVKNYEQATDPTITSPEITAQKEKVRKENRENAIDNATQRALKIKGLTAQPGSANYNKQKAEFQNQVTSGDATVGVDNNGMIGLKRTTKGWENLKNGWNEAMNGAEDARKFAGMSDQERVYFLNQNPDKLKPTPYIGESPNTFGSLTHLAGSSAPYMGKAVAGAAIGTALAAAAPETGGATLAGLPTAMAFMMTTPDMINSGIQNEVTSRYQILKNQHPERSDVENMAEARQGELSGGIGSIMTNAAMIGTGMKNPIAPEAKSVISNTLKGVFKNAVHMGGISAGVTAAQEGERNLEGVNTPMSEVFKKSLESFKENGTTGFLLSGLMHLPNLLKSAFKYGLVKSENPETIRATVQANENIGQVPPGTTEKVMKDLNDYGEALKKVPDGLTPESQASVAGLIQKKNNIVEESKTKDDAFKPAYKEKVDAINNQIADIQRTGKPLEHEVDEATGETYKKPTFDNIAAMNVKNLAHKISKGKDITDPKELQTEHNFPEELEKQLNRISKEEKSSNKDKENPNTELSDNITSYLKKNENKNNAFKAKEEVPVTTTPESIADKGTDTNIQSTEEKQSSVVSGNKNQTFEDLSSDEKNRLNDLAKKRFNKQELTADEHNEYVDLKKKQLEYRRQRELNDPLSHSYENTIMGTGKVHKGIGYSGEKYSVSITEDGHLSILKRNEETGKNEVVHEGDYGNKENALKEFDKHKQPIIDEINAKYDNQLSELPEKSKPITNKEVIPETNKTNQNAISERTAGKMGAHTGGNESIGGNVEGSGVGPSQQGNEPTGESGQPPIIKEEGKVEGEENDVVSMHHEGLGKLAKKLGLPEPEHGEVFSKKEYAERGQKLIDSGADPKQIAEDFEKDGKVNADIISVTRAHLVNLTKEAENARIKFGEKSPEYQKAIKEVQDWSTNVAKPMGTKFHEIGSSLQGGIDLDTGSYVETKMAVEEKTGKPLTSDQSKKVSELTNKVKEQDKIIEDLHKKFSEAIEKDINETKKASNTNKAKKIIEENKKVKDADADLIFQSTKRDYVAARVAKAVDKGESIEKAVDDLAKEGQIKPENVDKAKAYFNNLAGENKEPVTPEEKNIKRLEKQLADLKEGKSKVKPEEREKSAKEIELEKQIQLEKDRQLIVRMASKTGNTFTPEEVKDIWEYAKRNYVDKGDNINDIIRKTAKDLGLSSKQVLTALEQPKGAKVISDKMFVLQNRRTEVQNKVKEYVQTVNRSKIRKILTAVPNFFFQKAIFGHGTVGMITHAGGHAIRSLNVFNPSNAKIYWPLFFKQFKNSFGGLTEKGLANYEKSMLHLQNNPLFNVAKRAGVKVDPGQVNDDYAVVKKFLGKIGMMGDRGFNTLKEFRMAYFENEYNKLSDREKADPETLKELAKLVNHGTGTSNFRTNDFLNTAVFAPKLEASKWARVITDPAKSIATFSNWSNASMAEKAAAKFVAKKSGEFLGAYLGSLAINQALLYAAGSKQSINFTDPTKKDWLKYKMGDENVDISGGVIPTSQFIGHLLYLPFESNQELGQKEHRSRIDAFGKTVLDYGFSKLSPFASTGKDIVTAHDFNGNTMPWSDDKPKNKYAHKLTWTEYVTTQQLPIPVAEAFKDIYQSMSDRGMSDAQINDILTGIFKGVISGGTGAKVSTDYSVGDGATGGGGGASGSYSQPKRLKRLVQPKQRSQ